jgi:LmbE family N-acetylglucosaminyl deacetylase
MRALLAAAALFAAAAGAGCLWLASLFSEPGAAAVPSLAGALGAQRVLGVFAHPDDEQLVTGLLVRAKQRDGAFTALVTATRGEAGEQAPVLARQRDLAAVREAELLKNGFALGVDEQEVWSYPDGGVPEVPQGELVARIGGEAGLRIASATPDATHRMPGEVEAKLRGWQIHASQRDFVHKVYGVPARVLYWLWDEELYRVVELGG